MTQKSPPSITEQWRLRFAMILIGIISFAGPAPAGQPCEQLEMSVTQISNGINLAAQTAEALETHGVKVGVIARIGQDLSKWNQHYSHIGIVYRSRSAASGSTWRVVHKLNDCESDRANLYRQGLAEFFSDQPHDWETAVVPLSPQVAQKILPALSANQQIATLHEPRYSMVAYAWSTRYQQSNQWAVETLAMLIDPKISTRSQAQRWLSDRAYRPGRLRLGTFTRLGARVTKANVEFDDHPSKLRFSGRIDTTTADSVLRWLEQSGIGEPRVVVRLDRQRRY